MQAESLINFLSQCFDLKNYLDSNHVITGQRWKCLVCEDLVAYDQLELCGLTQQALETHDKEAVPTNRDRIEFASDGSYKLLEAKKERHRKKRAVAKNETAALPSMPRPPAAGNREPEVIVLDDD